MKHIFKTKPAAVIVKRWWCKLFIKSFLPPNHFKAKTFPVIDYAGKYGTLSKFNALYIKLKLLMFLLHRATVYIAK